MRAGEPRPGVTAAVMSSQALHAYLLQLLQQPATNQQHGHLPCKRQDSHAAPAFVCRATTREKAWERMVAMLRNGVRLDDCYQRYGLWCSYSDGCKHTVTLSSVTALGLDV